MRDADVARAELPVQPEPGIADLPPEPEPGIADLPTRDLKGPALWDRTVPFEPADDARLRPRD